TLDRVDVGLLHQPEELAGVRGKRLHVAPLALGVDGIESERGFPAAAQASDDGEAVAGDGDVDVLQVVFAGAANDEVLAALPVACVVAALPRIDGAHSRKFTATPIRI